MGPKRKNPVAAGWLLLLAVGCGGGAGGGDGGPVPPALDEPLAAGQVRAGVITRQSELLAGPEAHGWLGDFKLYNHRVAFVVQGLDDVRAWGPYGGGLIDAAALDAAGRSAPDLLQQVFCQVDLFAFRPDTAAVVDDGSTGGPARLRLSGRLQGIPALDAALGGLEPPALEVVQEYELAAGAEHLLSRTSLRAERSAGLAVKVGDAVILGDRLAHATDRGRAAGPLAPGDYAWLAGAHPDGCLVYAGRPGPLRSAFGLHELRLFTATADRAPGPAAATPLVVERLLAPAAGGLDACLGVLERLDDRVPATAVAGRLADATGEALAGVAVEALAAAGPRAGALVRQTYTDAAGHYHLALPAGSYRLAAASPAHGAVTTEPLVLTAGDAVERDLALAQAARLRWSCVEVSAAGDERGPLPCRLALQPGLEAAPDAPVAEALLTFSASGSGERAMPAGDWTLTASRGFEYSIDRRSFAVAAGDTVAIEARLVHQVDSQGLLAADIHSHTERSIDSAFRLDDKIAANMAAGVELLVLTDHDCQTDPDPGRRALRERTGLSPDPWIRLVPGIELSPLIGHATAFPLPVHPSGWVYNAIPWARYEQGRLVEQLAFPAVWDAARDRGAQIINLAHPLSYTAWLRTLGFDPPDTIPRLETLDPEQFADTFDTIELLDMDEVDVMLEQVLPVWSAMNNQGVFRTAVGVSDAHQREAAAGFGRTLIACGDDRPDRLALDAVWTALRQGRTAVAGGVLVWLTAGDAGPGELAAGAEPLELRVRVEAADWIALDVLELIANGEVVVRMPLFVPGQVDPERPALRFDHVIEQHPQRDTWYAALVRGPEGARLDPVCAGCRAVGLTNALRVDVDGDGRFDPPAP